MKWFALISLVFILSACGRVYDTEVVAYRTVEVEPIAPSYVVINEPTVDMTTTEVDYY